MPAQIRLLEKGSTHEQLREIPIAQPEFLIGRGKDCDLRLHASAISRHHCIIRQTPGETILVDLGSSNGTYLNGKRVRSQAGLQTGDEIRIANNTFVIDLGDGGEMSLGRGTEVDPTTVKELNVSLPKPPPPTE